MSNVGEITVIVRRILPEWEEIDKLYPRFAKKLNYIVKDNFDDLSDC